MPLIRAIIVDDEPLARERLRHWLSGEPEGIAVAFTSRRNLVVSPGFINCAEAGKIPEFTSTIPGGPGC